AVFDGVDEVAIESVTHLQHDATGASAHDRPTLPEPLAHREPEALPDRLLDHDVGDALERVDLHVADLMEVRERVDVGIAGAFLLHLVPHPEPLGVIGGHRSRKKQLRVRDLLADDPKRTDDTDRILPRVVPAHLAHDRTTDVEPVLAAELFAEPHAHP